MERMPAATPPVTVGVDTHLDQHVAAVVDQTGRLLDTQAFAASTRGSVALVTWAERFGPVEHIGVEGTGTYGAGLARFVRAYGLQVVEVNRPDRSTRRRHGKSDPIDAQAAARATLAGVWPRPSPRPVRPGRDDPGPAGGPPWCLNARVAAAEQLHGALHSAPEELRAPLLNLKTKTLVRLCAAMRPGPLTTPPAATKTSLRTLARRWQHLQAELDRLDSSSRTWSPRPPPPCSPCPGSASTPPGSCSSPPATTPSGCAPRSPSRTCAAPLHPGVLGPHRPPPAESRRRPPCQQRLVRIALVPMHCHAPTRAYVERRTKQGLSKLDILRCLKRYLAREIYQHLTSPPPTAPPACLQ
jgi:hypothetical protein